MIVLTFISVALLLFYYKVVKRTAYFYNNSIVYHKLLFTTFTTLPIKTIEAITNLLHGFVLPSHLQHSPYLLQLYNVFN